MDTRETTAAAAVLVEDSHLTQAIPAGLVDPVDPAGGLVGPALALTAMHM